MEVVNEPKTQKKAAGGATAPQLALELRLLREKIIGIVLGLASATNMRYEDMMKLEEKIYDDFDRIVDKLYKMGKGARE